jgi:hemoglobin
VHSHGGPNSRVPEKIVLANPDGDTLYERIGPEGILRLVKWFYAKVRYEPMLEPIFNAHIHVWSEHITTITQFWCKMMGGPSTWSGGMGRHFFLNLGPDHFEVWLAVWEQNALELLPYREATEVSALARRIGDDLMAMIRRAESRQ